MIRPDRRVKKHYCCLCTTRSANACQNRPVYTNSLHHTVMGDSSSSRAKKSKLCTQSDSSCASDTVRRLTIPTPDMEFGFHRMGKRALREALLHQIDVHRANEHLDLTAVLRGEDLATYHNYRLAAASWCAHITRLYKMDNMHTLTRSAIELLDRYAARTLAVGGSLVDVLRSIRVTRSACLLLACNVHAVYHSVFAHNVCRNQDWPATTGSGDEDDAGVLFASRDVIQKQTDVTLTLKGCLFPFCADNVARVFCKYILLEYKTRTTRDGVFGSSTSPRKCKDIVDIEQNMRQSAMELYTKRSLCVRLLQHKPIRCIAACCLQAAGRMLAISSSDQIALRDIVVQMLAEFGCSGITATEFKDISTLLITDCAVCTVRLCEWRVSNSLLQLSATWCYSCNKRLSS